MIAVKIIKPGDYVSTEIEINDIDDIKVDKIYKGRYYVKNKCRIDGKYFIKYIDKEIFNRHCFVPVQEFINLCK